MPYTVITLLTGLNGYRVSQLRGQRDYERNALSRSGHQQRSVGDRLVFMAEKEFSKVGVLSDVTHCQRGPSVAVT